MMEAKNNKNNKINSERDTTNVSAEINSFQLDWLLATKAS